MLGRERSEERRDGGAIEKVSQNKDGNNGWFGQSIRDRLG